MWLNWEISMLNPDNWTNEMREDAGLEPIEDDEDPTDQDPPTAR